MKEIGGYLELEELAGEEYYKDMYRLNLGRTALLYLCRLRGCKKLLLPYFLCDSVIKSCRHAGIDLEYYHIDSNLTPQVPDSLESGTYLYLVNYYGQITDETILFYKKKYQHIIVDHTHAFFQRPLPGVDTIYSCRKFFGLPDGAYLSTDASPVLPLHQDLSGSRMEHLLGRYEKDAASYYSTMLDNASSFQQESPKLMSRLTQNLLKGIDYERVIERREINYRRLDKYFGDRNPLPFQMPRGPFTYPFYYPKGIKLRKLTASCKLYLPTYWNNVIQHAAAESVEYDYASNILPLPCDQRYNPQDMDAVADRLYAAIKDLERKK